MKLWRAKYAVRLPQGGVRTLEDSFYYASSKEVSRYLTQKGYHPVSIKEQKEALFTWSNVRNRRWQIQILKALLFQSDRSSAGTALLNIAENETDPERSIALLPCRAVLRSGGSFSDAIKALKLFDATTVAILVSGEKAGDLKNVIQHAIKHIEAKAKQARIITGALGWLIFDIVSIITTVIGTHFGYIPYLKENANQMADLTKRAEFLAQVELAEFVNLIMMWGFAGFTVLGCLLAYDLYKNKHRYDHLSARIVRKIPLVGPYLEANALAESCRAIARLIKGRVPLDEGMKVVAEMCFEGNIKKYWVEARDRLFAGLSPQKALARSPLTKVERDQITSAGTLAQLSEVMDSIGEEKEYDASVAQRRMVVGGVFFLMVVFFLVVGMSIWLVYIQNEGLLEQINTIRGA